MTTELKILLCSAILGILHLMIMTSISVVKRGLKWNLSSREQPVPPFEGMVARFDKGLQNFKETFPFFIAAVLVAHLTKVESTTTALGAQLYFFGRLGYIPVLVMGISGLRTAVWTVSMVGIIMIIAASF